MADGIGHATVEAVTGGQRSGLVARRELSVVGAFLIRFGRAIAPVGFAFPSPNRFTDGTGRRQRCLYHTRAGIIAGGLE